MGRNDQGDASHVGSRGLVVGLVGVGTCSGKWEEDVAFLITSTRP